MDVPSEFFSICLGGILKIAHEKFPQVCPSVHHWRSLWTIDESHSGTQLGRKAQM